MRSIGLDEWLSCRKYTTNPILTKVFGTDPRYTKKSSRPCCSPTYGLRSSKQPALSPNLSKYCLAAEAKLRESFHCMSRLIAVLDSYYSPFDIPWRLARYSISTNPRWPDRSFNPSASTTFENISRTWSTFADVPDGIGASEGSAASRTAINSSQLRFLSSIVQLITLHYSLSSLLVFHNKLLGAFPFLLSSGELS